MRKHISVCVEQNLCSLSLETAVITLRARLHTTRSEVKPVRNLKPF